MKVEGDLFVRGPLRLRGLRDDPADFALLVRWLQDDRILRWYGGRDARRPAEEIEDDYRESLEAEEPTRPCIFEWQGRAIGYLQFCPLGPGDYGGFDPDAAWGIDLFIGETEAWSRGVGSELLQATVEYLCQIEGARALLVDPQVSNERAIRCYEKAGFRKHRMLPRHEMHEGEPRDHWLMVCEVATTGPA